MVISTVVVVVIFFIDPQLFYTNCEYSFLTYLFADVTILLSLTVFLNTVSESMPATSDAVPLISMQKEQN